MPSKNKCNNPSRNNHSVQQENTNSMKRTSLYPCEIDRVCNLEDKEPYMVPINSARENETKNAILPCMSQSVMSMSMNIFLHAHTMNNSHIRFEVK